MGRNHLGFRESEPLVGQLHQFVDPPPAGTYCARAFMCRNTGRIYLTNTKLKVRETMSDEFVERSLDEIRFWSRIMKEHSLFLRLGFRSEDTQLIQEANYFYA